MPQPISNLQPSLVLKYYITTAGVYPDNDGGGPGTTPQTDGEFLGAIRMTAASFAPDTDVSGQTLAMRQYSTLFSLLGTTYGGDGVTTFNLPNFAGDVAVGAGGSFEPRGGHGGTVSTTLATANLPGPLGGQSQPFDNHQPSEAARYLISVDGAGAGIYRAGTVLQVAFSRTPTGFLEADGRELNISDYPYLFDVLGVTYGGDGRTTFRLPDLTGRAIMGAGGSAEIGQQVGSADVTLTDANAPASVGGAGAAFDNGQPALVMTYLIAIEGIFPSYDGAGSGADASDPFIGEIFAYAGKDVPAGYLRAEGQTLQVRQHPALFSLVGITYGGDGVNTFKLPDLRGRVAVDDGGDRYRGETFGTTAETLDPNEIPAPAAPVITGPANGATVADDTPDITGTASPNSTVSVYIDGAFSGTTQANGSGAWTYTPATKLSEETHSITARASYGGDQSGPAAVRSVTVDVPNAPVLAQPTAVSLAESAAPGAAVATLSATDADGATGLVYSITGGNGAGLFTINAATGAVSLASGKHLDFETASQHQLTVRAADPTGRFDEKTLTIDVADVNEATAITSTASATGVLKGGDAVTFTLVTESAVGLTGTPELTLSNGARAVFAGLDGSGRLTFIYVVGANQDATNVTVTGLNLNGGSLETTELPFDAGSVSSATPGAASGYAVNSTVPARMGTPAALAAGTEDADYTVTTAQLLDGWTDAGSNVLTVAGLTSSSGTVTANNDGSYTITPASNANGPVTLSYTVTDGVNPVAATRDFTLAAVNDAPRVATAIPDQTTAEDAGFSFTLPSGTFADVDLGDALTLSATLSDGTALPTWLSFDPATGGFSGTPANGDVGTISVKVTATDGSAATISDTFVLTVTNTNDAPTAIALSGQGVAEFAEAGTVVGLLSTTDVDAGDSFTYRLVSDAGGRFALGTGVDAGKIVVADGLSLDFEQAASHQVTVEVRDAAGLTFTQTLTIAVTDQNPETVAGDERANTFVGGASDDVLSGLGGADSLDGGAGADTLIGGAGVDTMRGGTGDDRYVVDEAGDAVVEAVDGGHDVVLASVDYELAAGEHIETLAASVAGSLAALTLAGNEFGQTIYGNAGRNVLIGRAGADTLSGLGGDDDYWVDNAADVVTETGAGGSSDRVFAAVSYTLAAGQEIEFLTTNGIRGAAAIDLTGNEFAQALFGNAGGNVLVGGAGADTLSGFAGDDDYWVDNAADVVVEAGLGDTVDRLFSGVSYTLAAGQQIDLLATSGIRGTAAIRLTGNELAQELNGNAGGNVLVGGGGADTLSGFGGGDDYWVDDAADVVIETGAGGSVDRVFSAVSYTLAAGQQIDQLATNGIRGASAIRLTGNEFAQALVGNAGRNVLDGGAGADTLSGLGGADTFVFAATLGAGEVDQVNDFVAADDVFVLARSAFSGLSAGGLSAGAFKVVSAQDAVVDADDRILYDRTSGALFFDADGSGSNAVAVQFATLANNALISAADFLVT